MTTTKLSVLCCVILLFTYGNTWCAEKDYFPTQHVEAEEGRSNSEEGIEELRGWLNKRHQERGDPIPYDTRESASPTYQEPVYQETYQISETSVRPRRHSTYRHRKIRSTRHRRHSYHSYYRTHSRKHVHQSAHHIIRKSHSHRSRVKNRRTIVHTRRVHKKGNIKHTRR